MVSSRQRGFSPRQLDAFYRVTLRDNGEGEHGLVRIGESPEEVAFDPPLAA